MPIFRPLASLVWEEEEEDEVTYGHWRSGSFPMSHNEISVSSLASDR